LPQLGIGGTVRPNASSAFRVGNLARDIIQSKKIVEENTTMQNNNDRLIRYIQDAHAAEVGIANMLEEAINGANNLQVKTTLQEHLDVTRVQAQRLEARLHALGGETSGGKGFLNSLMGKVSDLLNIGHDDYDKTTQDLIKGFATEHLEIGMYTSLEAFATAMGDTETASLARQLIQEEKDAADKVYPLIALVAQDTYRASASVPVTA
jgi:ferritin-like metal-binding protein YciE